MTPSLNIASMMICSMPKYLNGMLLLSCSDSVWNPVDVLPDDIRPYVTDELGNQDIQYGGFLQLIDPKGLDLLSSKGLFACFRCITDQYLEHVGTCPPKDVYQSLIKNLKFMGWDIATGNGWLSASSHGSFPINPFTGIAVDSNNSKINEYGLFSSLDDCLKYCQINDTQIPEHAPWFPVAIYVDESSYIRLNKARQQLL